MNTTLRRILPLVLTAATAAACASTAPHSYEAGTILDARTGRAVTFDNMMDDLADASMVYVGESHNHPRHHEIQREILVDLVRHRPHLQLGMEMFQRPMQPVLDEWSHGDHDEGWFLREADWYGQWGFDWSLYSGIIMSAREHNVRLVALNVERQVTRAISQTGIDGLPGWLRSRMPEEVDLTRERHRASIRAIFDSHPGMQMSDERFNRFYQSQCTWDETMAESAVIALDGDPRSDAAILVIAGAMHVKDFDAIPERAYRRNGLPYRTVLCMELRGDEPPVIARGKDRPADYVIFTEAGPPMETLRLGVALRGGDNLVTGVPEGLPAHAAGLREGDVLLTVGGRTIGDVVDLRLALDSVAAGQEMALTWLRDEKPGSGTAVMTPPPPPTRP